MQQCQRMPVGAEYSAAVVDQRFRDEILKDQALQM
jgi:hypothetical protein